MKQLKSLFLAVLFATFGLLGVGTAHAELKAGDTAQDFTIQASLGGKEFTFSLADALKEGPVVLYFYPKAFTMGCTIEAHDFAEASDKYKALGATVIGISGDPIDTLNKFSVSECHNKFAVASDEGGKVMNAYDAVMLSMFGLAARVSYVILPSHKVLYAFEDSNPDQHVANTLKALQDWHAEGSPPDVQPTTAQ